MIRSKLPKEARDRMIGRMPAYFREERAETPGNLEAEQLLDFRIGERGPDIYNQAIREARYFLPGRVAASQDELNPL